MTEFGAYERLSVQDSCFVLLDRPTVHMHLAAVCVFDSNARLAPAGRIDLERVRAQVDSRLPPRYRRRLGFTPFQRQPILVEDARFDLRHHIRWASLPEPGSEEQLKELVARIMSYKLDPDQPLWELWCIEGLKDDRVAIVAKAHHCMVDGVGGVGVLTALLNPTPDESIETGSSWVPVEAPSWRRVFVEERLRRSRLYAKTARAIGSALRNPRGALSSISRQGAAFVQLLRSAIRLPVRTPLTRRIDRARSIDWCALDESHVSELKRQLHASENEILLTVIAGAVRRLHQERSVSPGAHPFRVAVPVNVRGGYGPSSESNHVSAWLMTLPIAEPDPLQRLAQIRTTRKLRRQRAQQIEAIQLLSRIGDWIGSRWLVSLGTRIVLWLRPFDLIVSAIPGPGFPVYFQGAPLKSFYPAIPLLPDQGVAIGIFSYLGRVFVSLIGDGKSAEDLAVLVHGIETSFEELRRASEGRAGVKARNDRPTRMKSRSSGGALRHRS